MGLHTDKNINMSKVHIEDELFIYDRKCDIKIQVR